MHIIIVAMDSKLFTVYYTIKTSCGQVLIITTCSKTLNNASGWFNVTVKAMSNKIYPVILLLEKASYLFTTFYQVFI